MLFNSLWSQLVFLALLTGITGYYLQWQACLSFVLVIEELYNLTYYVIVGTYDKQVNTSKIDLHAINDTSLALARQSLTPQITQPRINILEFFVTSPPDYLFAYWSYILQVSIFLSLLLLIDRIPAGWKTLRLANRVNTSRHNNCISLLLNETLAYLTSLPNLVTLTIGLIQAYSTSEYLQIDYPITLHLLVLLISCVYRQQNRWLSLRISEAVGGLLLVGLILRLMGIRFWIRKGNFVNLAVSVICWLFAVYQEWAVFKISSEMDERRNGNLVRRIEPTTGEVQYVRAEYLRLGDNVILREGEITPATLTVDRLRPINDKGDLSDYVIGTYYDRVTSGEDVSRKFVKGDTLLPERVLTRPDLEITAQISKYIEVDCPGERGDTVPHFLDRVRCIADLFGFLLLFAISLSVSASALAKNLNLNQNVHGANSLYNLDELVSHLLATAISANVLIPSMRMTLLYNVFNLVVSQLYTNVSISNYNSITKLTNLTHIIFDKTGTLTEECLEVHNCSNYGDGDEETNSLAKLAERLNWTESEVRFALVMANNESNINSKNREVWGTSPEECEILKYWCKSNPDLSLVNPLKDNGLISFSLNTSKEGTAAKEVELIKRHPYQFGQGKVSHIKLIPRNSSNSDNSGLNVSSSSVINLEVRQDGSSHISDVVSQSAKDWSEMCEKRDPRRSMSIAYRLIDNDRWYLLSLYSFENPLRQGIPNLMEFVGSQNLTPYILTGDGCEAAEEVSRRAGFPTALVRLQGDNLELDGILNGLTSNLNDETLIISGQTLSDWLVGEPRSARHFLESNRRPKVIYRASRQIKDQVTKAIQSGIYMGDAANDALAIKNSQVGIALAHGAEVCRLEAGLILKSPPDLIGLLRSNGYRDTLLIGGERLLEDVCWMGGLTAGCLVVGLHRHGFQFLHNSPLYLETWKPLPMLVVSSLQYTISALAYASADCDGVSRHWQSLVFSASSWHIVGLMVGILLAWNIKNWAPDGNFSYLVLHALDITILTKHSWHCLDHRRPRKSKRKSSGLFGNQTFESGGQSEKIGFILCVLDSLPARCLLYGIFSLIGERHF